MEILNDLLKDSDSKIIKSAIDAGGIIAAELFKGKKDYFLQNIDRAREIAGEVAQKTGLKGFITTGELPKYGISAREKDKILQAMEADVNDTVVLLAADSGKARQALDIIKEKVF
ncbi:MAG: GAD domain-containing protein [Elusimicrobiota bacterium]|nr:GAD domain-containing protein [Elusimicrobiota bacterium]